MRIFTNNLALDLLSVFIVIFGVAYCYMQYVFSYWNRRGIKSLKPSFPFGNFGQIFMLRKSIGEVLAEFHHNSSEPFIGVYASFRPLLIVRDTELIRRILIKDFNYFPNRGVYCDEERDPLSAHLFSLEDRKWKTLRAKLTPTFTSGKLRGMFPTLLDCSKLLDDFLHKKALINETFEARELAACHATNVIASVAFGNEVNCIENSNESFRYYGKKIFIPTIKNGLRSLCFLLNPNLMKTFGLKLLDDDVVDFMISVVEKNLELREKNCVTRKDFFQLLVQLRNGIDISEDDQWKITEREDGKHDLSLEEIAAQAATFFAAGFETSSTTLSFCMYEIAKRPDIQQRLHDEIDEVLERYNGQFTYDSLNEMKYLDMCIDGNL